MKGSRLGPQDLFIREYDQHDCWWLLLRCYLAGSPSANMSWTSWCNGVNKWSGITQHRIQEIQHWNGVSKRSFPWLHHFAKVIWVICLHHFSFTMFHFWMIPGLRRYLFHEWSGVFPTLPAHARQALAKAMWSFWLGRCGNFGRRQISCQGLLPLVGRCPHAALDFVLKDGEGHFLIWCCIWIHIADWLETHHPTRSQHHEVLDKF